MTQQSAIAGGAPHAKANGFTFTEDEIKHVPLTDIEADHKWNSRSQANVMSEVDETADDKTERFAGLRASLFASGQDEPVAIRKVQGGKTLGGTKTDKPYELLAGFRRFEAIKALNADKVMQDAASADKRSIILNTPNGTIRAVVKDLDAQSARSLNVRENTARNNLSTPDLVFGIREMSYGFKWPEARIRNELNLSQSYVNRLIGIAGIDRKILEHWRDGGEFDGMVSKVRASVNDLADIAKLKHDQQAAEYKKVLMGKSGAGKDNDKQWIEAGKDKAAKLGHMIGTLERKGFLKLTGKVAWEDICEADGGLKVSGKKEYSRAIARKFGSAAAKGYEAGKKEPEETEEEESGEE